MSWEERERAKGKGEKGLINVEKREIQEMTKGKRRDKQKIDPNRCKLNSVNKLLTEQLMKKSENPSMLFKQKIEKRQNAMQSVGIEMFYPPKPTDAFRNLSPIRLSMPNNRTNSVYYTVLCFGKSGIHTHPKKRHPKV